MRKVLGVALTIILLVLVQLGVIVVGWSGAFGRGTIVISPNDALGVLSKVTIPYIVIAVATLLPALKIASLHKDGFAWVFAGVGAAVLQNSIYSWLSFWTIFPPVFILGVLILSLFIGINCGSIYLIIIRPERKRALSSSMGEV